MEILDLLKILRDQRAGVDAIISKLEINMMDNVMLHSPESYNQLKRKISEDAVSGTMRAVRSSGEYDQKKEIERRFNETLKLADSYKKEADKNFKNLKNYIELMHLAPDWRKIKGVL